MFRLLGLMYDQVEREAFWEMVEDYPSAARAIFEVPCGQILTMMGRMRSMKDEGRGKGGMRGQSR